MSNYFDIIWTIASPPLAFLLGLAWQRISTMVVNRRARLFWRPMVRGDLAIILGRHRALPDFEPAGLIGVGAMNTLTYLTEYLRKIGFRKYRVHYNDQFDWSSEDQGSALKKNLVLVGGPDANAVTRQVLQHLEIGVSFAYADRRDTGRRRRPESLDELEKRRAAPIERLRNWCPSRLRHAWTIPVIVDERDGKVYKPSSADTSRITDCGVIIRSSNPFNTEKEVVIFAGCYGYGTLAAAQSVDSRDFLRRFTAAGRSIECLVVTNVVREMPAASRIQFLRTPGRAGSMLQPASPV